MSVVCDSCGNDISIVAHKSYCPTLAQPATQRTIDLSKHPLFPFFIEMVKEYERGAGKYGDWSTKDHDWQKTAVKSECLEWEATSLKTVDGKEREMQELTHLANVAGKRWIELKRG